MTKDRIVFFLFILVLCVLTYFSLNLFNPKRAALHEAKILLKEFKAYKAIDVLKAAKTKIKKEDKDLDAFIIYAYVKAKEFDEAEIRIKKLKVFPYLDKDDMQDLLEILSENEQNQLLAEIIAKLTYSNLDENFFVKLSSEKNSLETEMQILDSGFEYLNRMKKIAKKSLNKKISTVKLEEYYVSRCIDAANISLANEDYETAKKYLERPIELDILDNSTLKDRLYFDLAFTYEKLGNPTQAKHYLEISAKLGNHEAREVLTSMAPEPLSAGF